MLFPLRVIRRIHREGFRCIPEAIRFRIALHRQRPFLQTETALRQAEEDGYQAFIRRHEAPLSSPFTPTMRLSFLIPTYNTPPELLRALADRCCISRAARGKPVSMTAQVPAWTRVNCCKR